MSIDITEEMVETAYAAALHASTIGGERSAEIRAAVAAVGPLIEEAVARGIATKLRTMAADRAQMDDMAGFARFKEAAGVATAVAKGGGS